MEFYLISDNQDTLAGMRLAGIEGAVVHEREEILAELEAAQSRENTGIVLITDKLAALVSEEIRQIKLESKNILLVEIPDRHGGSGISEILSEQISSAIGMKVN